MLSVTGCEDVDRGFGGTGEDRVVGGIATEPFSRHGRRGLVRRELFEQTARFRNLLGAESQLHLQDSLKLSEDDLRQDELDSPFDGLIEEPARGTIRDQRGHEHVRVAKNAPAQRRSLRTASTSASASSGATPRSSARARP